MSELSLVEAQACRPRAEVLTPEQAASLASLFKALADPVRLRLVALIADAGRVCVCELTPHFDLSGPTISHHLKVLREAGLVDGERTGTWIHYWIRPEVESVVRTVLSVQVSSASAWPRCCEPFSADGSRHAGTPPPRRFGAATPPPPIRPRRDDPPVGV